MIVFEAVKDFLTQHFIVIVLLLIWLQNFKWKGFNYYFTLFFVYANPKNWFQYRWSYFLITVEVYKDKYGISKGKVAEKKKDELKHAFTHPFKYRTTGNYPNEEHLFEAVNKELDPNNKHKYTYKAVNVMQLTYSQYLEWIAKPKLVAAAKAKRAAEKESKK